MATQEASGLWSAKVLELTSTKTITLLISLVRARIELIKEKIGSSREIKPQEWYTLVGLKLLKDNFQTDEPGWRQAAEKAKNALI